MSENDLMWEPKAYPKCSKCGVPWALRRVMSITHGVKWWWTPDCKHKQAEPELVEVADA